MLILGIDPGTILTGYGVINFSTNNLKHTTSGVIKLSGNDSLPHRLEIIYNELSRIIEIFKPDEFAIETAFFGKNVQSAMKIGYARGVSILAAMHHKIPVSEYSPREIKKSVVGKGAASKEQVNFMIKSLLNLETKKIKYDESDALATAICHAFRMKNPAGKKGGSWKSFTEAFPERIINQ